MREAFEGRQEEGDMRLGGRRREAGEAGQGRHEEGGGGRQEKGGRRQA